MPTVKLAARWFGAEEKIVQMGYDYILPLTVCTTTTCLLLTAGGFLQGEGRTMLSGLSGVACLCLNMVGLNPLFLFGFKMGIRGASISTVASEVLTAAVLIGLYYAGKFGVKIRVRDLCRKFSPRTIPALKIGLSQLLANLSMGVPSILVRKLVGLATDDFNNAMAGFNAAIRYSFLAVAIPIAICGGFIPAASYAYAAKNYRRWFWLSLHSFWTCCVWGCLAAIVTFVFPRQISMLFADSEGYLDQATQMVRIINAVAPVAAIRLNAQAMLQSMQRGNRAILLSLFGNFALIVAISFLMYYTNKHDGPRIIWCYPISYACAIPLALLFLARPCWQMWKLMKEQKEEKEEIPLDNIKQPLADGEPQFVDEEAHVLVVDENAKAREYGVIKCE
jgi:Na+-driven multidrug efflux pump